MFGIRGAFGEQQKAIEDYHAEFEALEAEEQERLSRFRDYREENEAPRNAELEGFVAGEEITDYGRKRRGAGEKRHDVKLPFGKALSVKNTYRLAGRPPEFIVDRRDETPQERYRSETMTKLAWAVVRASDGEQQMATAAWDGSELGSGCYDIYFSDKKGMPVFRAVDPAGIIVVPGVDDEHDFERVYRFWEVPLRSLESRYGKQEFRGSPVMVSRARGNGHKRGLQEMATLVQVSTRDTSMRFCLGGCVPLGEFQHNYGFAPYIVQPNLGPQRDIWGWSDYEFFRLLSQYLGKLLSREADVIAAVANGALIEKGTGLPPSLIKQIVATGGVIQSKREGSVEPVKAPDMPAYTAQHTGTVLELLKMLSFSPDAAWGQGGATTGTDRALQLMPQLELTALKQVNAASALNRLFRMAYKMIETRTAVATRFRGAVYSKGQARAFKPVTLGPDLSPTKFKVPGPTEDFVEVPRTLPEIFDGEYELRAVFANRIDPDDPAFVVSETAKFRQGVQSLQTTLENLGVNVPEDEMRRIEDEAERFPWLNNGMIALVRAHLSAQGAGEGQGVGGGGDQSQPFDSSTAALGMLAGESSGGLSFDAANAGNDAPGPLYGGA